MMGKQKSNDELGRFRNGDARIVNKLYGSMTAYVLQWKKTYNLSDDDINDIVQNTMCSLVLNVKDDIIKLRCALTTYALGFTKKQILRFAEKRGNYRKLIEAAFIDEQLLLEDKEDRKRVVKWSIVNQELKKLSEECQTLFDLKMEDMSQIQIAKIVGTESVKYIKKRMYLCRKKLLELIKNNPNYKTTTNYDE